MTLARPQVGTSQARAVLDIATPARGRRYGSAVASLATLAVVGLLLGAAPAGAIVITGGPTYTPPNGWTCTTPVSGNEKLGAGQPIPAAATAGAYSNLYIGIKNTTCCVGRSDGEKMNSNGTRTRRCGDFAWSGETGPRSSTRGHPRSTPFGTVFLRQTLRHRAGSVVDDAQTQALSNANGDVHSLWRIGPAVTSMTVNSLIEASTSSGGPWTAARTFFGTTSIHRQGTGSTEVDKSHVDIGFYYSTCGDGTVDTNFGREACDLAGANGGATSCCSSTCAFTTNTCRASAGQCDLAETCTGASSTCPGNSFQSAATPCTGASQAGPATNTMRRPCTGQATSARRPRRAP